MILLAAWMVGDCVHSGDDTLFGAISSSEDETETSTSANEESSTGREDGFIGDNEYRSKTNIIEIGSRPIARADRYFIQEQGQSLEVSAAQGLLANDVDPKGGTLTADDRRPITTREGGQVQLQADGGFTYTPPVSEWWGEDGFVYRVLTDDGRFATGSVRVVTRPQSINLRHVRAGIGGVALLGEHVDDYAGSFVNRAGDVNGDGFPDVLVGATGAGDPYLGKSYIMFGGPELASTTVVELVSDGNGLVLSGEPEDRSGGSGSGLGDVNGDGISDLIIGATEAAVGGQGRGYIVLGSPTLESGSLGSVTSGSKGHSLYGENTLDLAGESVSDAGDVNGDGFMDLLIGAYTADISYSTDVFSNEGKAYVVFGGPSLGSASLVRAAQNDGGFALIGEAVSDVAGDAVSSAGDMNGDGYADVIIGAPGATSTRGKSYIVFGASNPMSSSLAEFANETGGFALYGEDIGDYAGNSVRGAGDVNGDGYADVIIGTKNYSDDFGKAYVVFGGPNLTSRSFAEIAAGDGGFGIREESPGGRAGDAVSGAGDINGDGYADLIIGAPGRNDSGKAYVVFGGANLESIKLSDIAAGNGGFRLEGESSNDRAGNAVSGAGDINGDGYADLVMGASHAGETGRAYVVFGGDFTLSAAFPGTPADDTFVGTLANESIIGGRGNDTLSSGGGRDTLYGGHGDDTLILPRARFFRLHGGEGDDRLQINGSLDLTRIPELAISSIETIDITGTRDNALTLVSNDLFHLTETRQLTIEGDEGDILNADLQGHGFIREDDLNYAVFTSQSSKFSLRVSLAIDLNNVAF